MIITEVTDPVSRMVLALSCLKATTPFRKLDGKSNTTFLLAQSQAIAMCDDYGIASTPNAEGIVLYTKIAKGIRVRIEGLFVLPEYRGKGIGRELVNYVLDKTNNKDVDAMVMNENTLALKFWANLSKFKPCRHEIEGQSRFATKPNSNKKFITAVASPDCLIYWSDRVKDKDINLF